MLSSHDYVQYALLTLLVLVFRLDPPSTDAALAALSIWEINNRTPTAP